VEARVRETLVLLTQDAALASAVRASAAAEHELFVVQAEADLATHLLGDAAGVLVLDTAAVVSTIAQLTQSLKAQFPDVVLIVAGSAHEQAALAPQVTSGAVYRFLHKPASEQRIRLFIDAAWRRRSAEHISGATVTLPMAPARAAPRRPALWLGITAVALAAAIGGWLMGQGGRATLKAPVPEHIASRPATAAHAAPAPDVILKQLLARAADALSRGDLLLPAGNGAADLYRQALERHRGDPQAQAGIDKVVDRLLSAAEQDLLAQHLDEAEHLTQAAHGMAPDSVRVAFLVTQIGRERERAVRAQARLASQQQQQQADELDRQQKLTEAARTALATRNLDEAGRLIASATDAGIDHDVLDALTRDLQGARLAANLNETLAKPQPVATIEAAHLATLPKPAAAAVPEAAQGSDVISANTLERLKYVEPEYPLAARAQGTNGWVDLAFDVQTDGSVNNVLVIAAEPANVFERAAVAAVRRWRYRPIERDGQAVAHRAQLRIRFAVQ
jgi:protein TonB